MLDLKHFKAPSTTPELVGGIGQGGDTDKFVALFGMRWRKTPKKDVWFIGCDGMQFTMVLSTTYGMDFAFYEYLTIEEFKKDFEAGTHVFNAQYFQLTNNGVQYKYPALRIIDFLKQQILWE